MSMTDVSEIISGKNGLRNMKYIFKIGDYNKRVAPKN